MNIREATIADAPAIAHVHLDSWRNTYRGLVSDEFLDGLRLEDRVKRWEQRLRDGESGEFVFVAIDVGGDVIAFGSGGPERTGHPDYKGELWALHVAKEYQGIGLGRQLLCEVAKRLRGMGIDSLMLWVIKGNPYAGFYEKLGGVYVTERVEEFAGGSAEEIAYGWPDSSPLIREGS